jgi:hypothetical protein
VQLKRALDLTGAPSFLTPDNTNGLDSSDNTGIFSGNLPIRRIMPSLSQGL